MWVRVPPPLPRKRRSCRALPLSPVMPKKGEGMKTTVLPLASAAYPVQSTACPPSKLPDAASSLLPVAIRQAS